MYDKAEASQRTIWQLLFSQSQLAGCSTKMLLPSIKLQAAVVIDLTKLLSDIREALEADPKYLELTGSDINHQNLQ